MNLNRGELRHQIEVWGQQDTQTVDELDENVIEHVKIATVCAKKEFRGGGLLTGRIADTILTRTTHKFTYPYYDCPSIIADKNWIIENGKRYDILYVYDEDDKHELLQVFVEEKIN